ncbi:hypothetical protein LMH87_006632 [Akanthomyces muscarius]|uniref:Uncharacterized protein n=1 Tax=Akanthomyces muscarius TaxID=2231603 RepID=A0A9W8UT02_AKAMU|nr:hypothetical protein LMH87_006632 [Akanthomyces muscarius]KAJ4164980.1 hypothetical protein LMH87_006632 [Akanthomyces muscarius]
MRAALTACTSHLLVSKRAGRLKDAFDRTPCRVNFRPLPPTVGASKKNPAPQPPTTSITINKSILMMRQ